LEGLTYPQVAKVLGVPVKTAQKRVERGVERLRDWRREEEGRG
jgi:DNA-directed RNA polymerase specialized sigma24 family protein